MCSLQGVKEWLKMFYTIFVPLTWGKTWYQCEDLRQDDDLPWASSIVSDVRTTKR